MNVYSPDDDSHRLIAGLVAKLGEIHHCADDPALVRSLAKAAIAEAANELRAADGYCRCPECGSACSPRDAPGSLSEDNARLQIKIRELESALEPMGVD